MKNTAGEPNQANGDISQVITLSEFRKKQETDAIRLKKQDVNFNRNYKNNTFDKQMPTQQNQAVYQNNS